MILKGSKAACNAIDQKAQLGGGWEALALAIIARARWDAASTDRPLAREARAFLRHTACRGLLEALDLPRAAPRRWLSRQKPIPPDPPKPPRPVWGNPDQSRPKRSRLINRLGRAGIGDPALLIYVKKSDLEGRYHVYDDGSVLDRQTGQKLYYL